MKDDFSVEDVARYWDENAAGWAEQVRRGADVAREWLNNPAFLAFVGDLRGRRVLDAGCGEGYNTRILARRGARMTGVDISEKMLARLQQKVAKKTVTPGRFTIEPGSSISQARGEIEILMP